MRKTIHTSIFLLFAGLLSAQNVGIGTASPNASAKLDIVDANRGILLPRVQLTSTTVAAPVATPANWLVVFNTQTINDVSEGLYYWNGTRWVRITSTNDNWLLNGNSNGALRMIGTNDNFDFPIETNNTERMRVTSAGNVGIGTSTPSSRLHLQNGRFQQETTTDISHSLYLNNTVSNRGWQLYHLGSTDGNAPNGFMFEYFDGTSWGRRMTINQAGNVGIGVATPAYKTDIAAGGLRNAGVIHTGATNQRQHLNVSSYSDCTPPTGASTYLIQTTIPCVNGNQMPTVRVWGTAYSEGTIDLQITWHYFSNTFLSASYVNRGSWRPSQIRLANVGGFVALEIQDGDGLYCPKFTVDAFDYSQDSYFDGWATTAAVLPGAATTVVTVPQTALGSVVSNAWLLGGNTTGALRNLGTVDNFDFPFITNNTERMRITNGGNVGIGLTGPVDRLQVGGGNVRVGEINGPGSGAYPNTGRALLFSGGASAGVYDSDNSDPLYIQRRNIAQDQADLQFIIGDNGASPNNDRITIGDATTQRIALASSGHVGINTLSPATNLHVVGNTRLEQNAATLQLVGNTAGHAYIEYYPQNLAAGRMAYLGFPTNGSNNFNIYNENPAGNINLSTAFNGGTPELTVNANGNVGIGTINPSAKLEMAGTGSIFGGAGIAGANNSMIHASSGNATTESLVRFGYWNGTINTGIYDMVKKSGDIFAIRYVGSGSEDPSRSVYLSPAGQMVVGGTTFSSKFSVQGSMELQNSFDNVLLSRSDAQARNMHLIGTYMGWDQRGIFLGGYNQNNPAGSFSDANRIYCGGGGAAATLPISATAFTVSSSQRYKQNIIPSAYGLSTIMQLRPVQYQYNFDKLQQTHIGLIAEEVNKVVPEIVVKQDAKGEETKDLNGQPTGVNYSELVPVLIKAVQEQQQQIQAQELQIKQLQQQIDDLNRK